jgi:thiamine-monophosphate kinase
MPKLTSENRLIRLLQDRYPAASPLLAEGIGDDAAVIRPGHAKEYWLVTSDMLLEGVDFRREWTTPRRLGSKAIAVNLSDLAAMGARPRFYTVSLAVPQGISERWILDLYDGMTEPQSSRGAQLVGGDLSRSESGILIAITALGESLDRKLLYRRGGRAGDLLYVTGVLGRSAAGLELLRSGRTHPRARAQREAVRAHQMPEPRTDPAVWLAQCGQVRCMMDLSDGLSIDCARMCRASGVGAEIFAAALPVFPESRLWGCDPVRLALHGGEDYELLFAVPESESRLLEKNYPSAFPKITRIGRMTRDVGRVWLLESERTRRRLPEHGYDHFRQARPSGAINLAGND